MNALWVAAGGALGAAARYGVNEIGVRLSPAFPWHTIAVNVAGCFAMGLLTGLLQSKLQLSEAARLFLITGILGGFTTFSAFAIDFAHLAERKAFLDAFGYAFGSVVLSLVAVFAGLNLARTLA